MDGQIGDQKSKFLPTFYKDEDNSNFSEQLDLRIKRVKRGLEDWREVVLFTNNVFTWERTWHPTAIFIGSTLAFITMWLWDPSLLTAISLFALLVCILDYCGPVVSTTLLRGRGPWTAAQERQLDDLCRQLVLQYTHTTTALASFFLMRSVRPRVFYTILGVIFITLSWIGSVVHNLFLTYLFVSALLLMPGLMSKKLLTPYTHRLTETLLTCLATSQQKID